MKFITRVENSLIVIKDKTLEKLEGKIVEVEVKAKDEVEYWQHKYYRGYLLPAIARQVGEFEEVIHIYLKYKYLFVVIDDVDEIPKKKLSRGIYVAQAKDIISMNISYAQYISGAIIVCDGDYVIGYIPSLATISKTEFSEYLIACESFLVEVGGGLESEAEEVRQKVMDLENG